MSEWWIDNLPIVIFGGALVLAVVASWIAAIGAQKDSESGSLNALRIERDALLAYRESAAAEVARLDRELDEWRETANDLQHESARLTLERDALLAQLGKSGKAMLYLDRMRSLANRAEQAEAERDALKADSKRLAEVLALVEASPVTLTAAAESYAHRTCSSWQSGLGVERMTTRRPVFVYALYELHPAYRQFVRYRFFTNRKEAFAIARAIVDSGDHFESQYSIVRFVADQITPLIGGK